MNVMQEQQQPIGAGDVGGVDNWPVTVDTQYEEDGPSVGCGGWTRGYAGHLFPCRRVLRGSNLAELRADLETHLRCQQHYQCPFLGGGAG